jgi:predicted lipoprotein with Yx(FWY)xxD motif
VTRDARAAVALARAGGAGLLFATAAIHLDLYVTGYETVPTIGVLFLLQLVAGFALGLALLVTGSRIVAALGAGLALSTLAGYLVALRTSLFGFREVRTTAGVAAGVVEVLAFAVLGLLALAPPARADRATFTGRTERGARTGVAVVTVAAAIALGVGLGASITSAPGSSTGHTQIDVGTAGGHQVLTDASGHTLYWFAPDTPTHSACSGSCAVYWPPVTGTPVAGPGVIGALATIPRAGGARQVTYNGHPLYTYVGDSSPGEAHGNGITLNGGAWYEMTPGS